MRSRARGTPVNFHEQACRPGRYKAEKSSGSTGNTLCDDTRDCLPWQRHSAVRRKLFTPEMVATFPSCSARFIRNADAGYERTPCRVFEVTRAWEAGVWFPSPFSSQVSARMAGGSSLGFVRHLFYSGFSGRSFPEITSGPRTRSFVTLSRSP